MGGPKSASGDEIEVKIAVESHQGVLERLREPGATPVRERHLEDNRLFDFPDMAITRSGCLLRVRRRPGEGVLTFKGRARREQGAKVREEKEISVEDPSGLTGILEKIGLNPIYRYQKFRAEFDLDQVRVAVDELPFGNFIELEGDHRSIRRVAERLGFGPGDFLTSTYRSLHLKHAEQIGKPAGNLLFPEGVEAE